MDYKRNINREFYFKSLWLPESEREIDHAIYLIVKELPRILHPVAWEEIKEEFLNLDFTILSNLETLSSHQFISIAELCGVKFKTLTICYNFGKTLLLQKKYDQAKAIFIFLTLIYPDYPLFWLGLLLCLEQLKDSRLLEYMEISERLFPKNFDIKLFCAKIFIHRGSFKRAYNRLAVLKASFLKNPSLYKKFGEFYEFLWSRLK